MRVLHLWDEFEPQWFDKSFETCREEGIPAELLTMRLVLPPRKTADGLRYVRKLARSGPADGILRRGYERIRRPIDVSRFRRATIRTIEEFRPDIIHSHYGTTAAALLPVLESAGLPFAISFYGYDISQALNDDRIKSAYRRLIELNPLLHVLCKEAAQRARSLGARDAQIVEANLPLPVERYPFVGLEGDSISNWLIPARFVEKKGHLVLLDAFRMLVDRDSRHRLTCWGGYGRSAPIQARIDELGLHAHVTIASNRKDGPFDAAYVAQLRKHDVVLGPSIKARLGDDEGGPALTAVLAQVAGKPVIFSDFPGSERSVTSGVEGLIVPQGNAQALAEAMLSLASDPARAARMGEAGRERTLREFSRAAYRDALLAWYRRLIG